MLKQFFVIGAGRFGTALASTLYDLGHEVVVADIDSDAIDEVKDKVTHAVIADATDTPALQQLGVSNFDAVIVAIGDDLESSILATAAAIDAGAKRIIAKAKSDVMARILSRVGAHQVVQPEFEGGARLAHQLATPEVLHTLSLGENFGVMEIDVAKPLCGSLSELRLPTRFGVQVITVNRKSQLFTPPPADFRLEHGDKLLVVGDNRAIERLHDFLSDQ